MKALKGKVAVVAGATRGAGRGIACGLGEAGATVYCTGRSVRGQPATGTRPETIEETAERVTARGGVGRWAQVDHTVEEQVEALFARVRDEEGRLDILVNDVWGGDSLTEWGKSFWELDPEKGFRMMEVAIHTHLLTSRHGVPLMLERSATDGGLLVEITDGDGSYYRGNLFYDLVKTSIMRLASTMAQELQGSGLTALAVTPGFLRSERMLELFEVDEESWQQAADPHFAASSETPFYIGRAIAALAADPDVGAKAGQTFATWTLMREYGFEDVDGRQPDWGTYIGGVVTAALTEVVRSGDVSGAVSAGDRPAALERLRETVLEVFQHHGLHGVMLMLPADFYDRVFDLGAEPSREAVSKLAEGILS